MLSRCANSQCNKPFLRLGQGRLFVVEAQPAPEPSQLHSTRSPYLRKDPRRIERYWLCGDCAETWTLIQDTEQGVTLAPIRRKAVGAEMTALSARQSA